METARKMEPILSVQNLATSFRAERGLLKAVDGVSFDVYRGEILGIVGESGCGKSVTAQSILRLYDERQNVRYDGEIFLEDRNLLKLPERAMQSLRGHRISMIFQDALSALNPVFCVGDQIMEHIRIHQKVTGLEAAKRAKEMLRLVGIPDPDRRFKQFPHELSGGMRQRVMIAIALACRPDILIADEPTTALDVTIQAQIMELIVSLNQKLGMGVMLITHDLAVVAETCGRVIVMYLGQIVEEAKVPYIFDHPAHPYTVGLLESIPRLNGPRDEMLHQIQGTVPLLSQIPKGCRFAPRCPKAEAICRERMPEIRPIGPDHRVRCHLA